MTSRAAHFRRLLAGLISWYAGGDRMDTPGCLPRRFHLVRHHDVTGVSGTGVVAEGVEFSDGTVVVRWRGDRPSTVTWASVGDAIHVHGHNGATELVWLDREP